MPQISVKKLSKTYHVPIRAPGLGGALRGLVRRQTKVVRALDAIDFSIERGELVGYIGPNAAGKSTTIKILSGILVPDAGEVSVLGRVPWQERIETVRRLGVVFGQRSQLWWDLPVIESFHLLRAMYAVEPAAHQKRLDELASLLELGPVLDTPVRQLSLGLRMRCELVAALLHAPEIIFLDEPTIGLDAVAKIAVRGFVQRLNKEHGVTVILTSHDMDDVELLCSRLMVLGHGKLLFDGSLQQLRQRVKLERRMTVDLETEEAAATLAAAGVGTGARVVDRDGARAHLAFTPELVAAPALIARVSQAYPVKDLFLESPSIENVIAKLYSELRL